MRATALAREVAAGPIVLRRSWILTPMIASRACTITIAKAIASRKVLERAKSATTAVTASARLLADAYIELVRQGVSDPASAAIEYPRLTKALIAVTPAQTQKAADMRPIVDTPIGDGELVLSFNSRLRFRCLAEGTVG